MLSNIISALETLSTNSFTLLVGTPTQMESVGSSPYVWVAGFVEQGGSNQRVNCPVIQRINASIILVIGALDLDTLLSTRDAVRSGMLNSYPTTDCDPVVFGSGRLEFGDAGWWHWRDEYSFAYHQDTL